jgi:homoprotocatechuate degradation regulator HpaR
MKSNPKKLAPYRQSLAGTLLAAREAVMAPIRPVLTQAGVTEQQWRVLRVLDDSGPTDLKTLADSALLFGPSVTRILKDLVERGLVIRQANPKDGRGAIVSLSASGQALIAETAAHTIQQLNIYARKFGDKRLKSLIAELKAFAAAIR